MPTNLDTYAPFDAGAGANVTEGTWRKFARLFASDGVAADSANHFEVYANSTGMQVKVKTGQAWVRGHYGESTAEKTLAIAAADATNPRIDRVILRADFVNNRVELDVLTGTPAAPPAAPSPTQSSSLWEVSLAQVSVPATDPSIDADQVTDERTYMGRSTVKRRVLGSAASTILVPVPQGSGRHLRITAKLQHATAAATNALCQFNGDTANNYRWQTIAGAAGAAGAAQDSSDPGILVGIVGNESATRFATVTIDIPDYAGSQNKALTATAFEPGNGTTSQSIRASGGWWTGTAAITSITLAALSGNFAAGSEVTVELIGG